MALVGLDGSIYWLCLPRFDSELVFCGFLDRKRGGHFTIAADELTEARQHYEPDTGVLVTELRSPTGLVRLTDALALLSGADLTDDVPAGRGELVRSAVVLDGNVRLRVELEQHTSMPTMRAAAPQCPRTEWCWLVAWIPVRWVSSRSGPVSGTMRSWRTGNGPGGMSRCSPSRPCPRIGIMDENYLPVVVGVAVVSDRVLRLLFSDGTVGDVDFSFERWTGVLEPLNDPAYFAQVEVDPEAGTVVWPGGIDLAPEPLYEQAKAHPLAAA